MQRILPIAAGLVLAIPSVASAAATSAGGQTDLSLSPKAAKALTAAGVKVTPVDTAATASGAIPFPITGVTPKVITHSGGLKLSKGSKALTLKTFRIVFKGGVPVRIDAFAGSVKVPAFDLDARKAKTATDGLDAKVGPVRVKLSAVGAGAIAAKLGVKLPKGYALGSAKVILQAAATGVTLDAGTAAVLKGLGVAVAPEGAAKAGSTIQFPITNPGGKDRVDRPDQP